MWAGPPGSAPGHAARAAPHRLRRPAVGGPGRGGSIGAPVAIVGGGPEPLPRAARKSAARTGAQGPRARGSGRAAAEAGGPPPAGGRRAEGSGEREEGEGRREPPRAGAGPAGPAARAAARPRKGYLLHGSLDGGVWGLGLLQQLQDLLKSLLVRFPLILHFGLLQIKPETGRDGANVTTPHTQARGLPAPSNPFLPARTTPALPRRLGPVRAPEGSLRPRNPGELILAVRPPISAAPAAAAAERKEPTRLSHREFAIWPQIRSREPLGPNATQFSSTLSNSSSVRLLI